MKKDTKKRIYTAAIDLLKEGDISNMTIREICKKAGATTGSFYHFFRNKYELFISYFDQMAVDLIRQEREALAGLNPYHQIEHYLLSFIKRTSELGVDFCKHFFIPSNIIMNSTQASNKIDKEILMYLDSHKDILITDKSTQQIANELNVIVKGILFDWCSKDGSYDPITFARPIIELYLDSIYPSEIEKNS